MKTNLKSDLVGELVLRPEHLLHQIWVWLKNRQLPIIGTKKLKKRKQLIMNELSTENLILVWLIPDLAHLCLGDHVDFGNRKHGFGNDIWASGLRHHICSVARVCFEIHWNHRTCMKKPTCKDNPMYSFLIAEQTHFNMRWTFRNQFSHSNHLLESLLLLFRLEESCMESLDFLFSNARWS